MRNRFTTIFLAGAALLLALIGGAILLNPLAFHAPNGIEIENDASLLSEIRAPGALLLSCAIIICAGAFRPVWRSSATLLTVIVYGSFAVARLLSLALDGMPAPGIMAAGLLEGVVATLGLWLLIRPTPLVLDHTQTT